MNTRGNSTTNSNTTLNPNTPMSRATDTDTVADADADTDTAAPDVNDANKSIQESSQIPIKTRKRTLFVIIAALLIDLLAFTIILPLFPRVIKYYEVNEPKDSLYRYVHGWISQMRLGVLGSSEKRLDIVLFGGLVGSLYSFLQFLSAPFIGKLSDKYGRRKILLLSMIGNAVSMFLWVFADRFEIFLASRIIGGLTEGNVQLSIAMISDISDEANRSRALALVGISFSVGFTIGPPLGAYFATLDFKSMYPSLPFNSFSTPALFALFLIFIETIYMFFALPETLDRKGLKNSDSDAEVHLVVQDKSRHQGVISLTLLSQIHFMFLFLFSGMEFTLTFLTYDSNVDQGMLLSFMGVLTALLQGGYVRRKGPNRESRLVLQGIVSCGVGLFFLGFLARPQYGRLGIASLYTGVAFLSVTNATVVTCLTALASFSSRSASLKDQDDKERDRGAVLGVFRSIGQLGRCLGPLFACSGYWIIGSIPLYLLAGFLMILLALYVRIVFSYSVEKLKTE